MVSGKEVEFEDTSYTTEELLKSIETATDDRIYAIAELFRRKVDMMLINNATKIDAFFLDKIHHIISVEQKVKANPNEKYLEILADYLILCMEKQEKKEK